MARRADIPFAPRRVPFFYGWVVVAVATVGVLMSIPGQTMGVSVFTDSILEATGLSRLTVSNAYLAGTLLSGLSLPWAGTRVDRLGARPAGFVASVGLGLMLLFMSAVDRWAEALGGSVAATTIVLSIGFFGLRFLGQGVLTMVSRTMLGRWFDRRRGLAAGISGVAIGFGFGVAPRIFDDWIRASTWRGAWTEMGLVVAIGMALVALLFFRNDPESCGLRMDGRPPATSDEPEPDEVVYSRKEALQTLAFWAVTASLACHALLVTGITFHIVDLGASVGLDRSAAVRLFLPLSVIATVVGLVGGALGDRLPVRSLLVALLMAEGLGIVAAADLSHRFWLAVVGLGIASGLFNPISTIAYPRFFGRRHLGAIVGVEMMSLVIASALGPSLLAASRSIFGLYSPALYGSLLLPGTAMILVLGFRHPAKQPAAGST